MAWSRHDCSCAGCCNSCSSSASAGRTGARPQPSRRGSPPLRRRRQPARRPIAKTWAIPDPRAGGARPALPTRAGAQTPWGRARQAGPQVPKPGPLASPRGPVVSSPRSWPRSSTSSLPIPGAAALRPAAAPPGPAPTSPTCAGCSKPPASWGCRSPVRRRLGCWSRCWRAIPAPAAAANNAAPAWRPSRAN